MNGSTDARPICEKLVLFLESSPAHFYELNRRRRRKPEIWSALVPRDKKVQNSTRREEFCAGVVLPNALLTLWPRRECSFSKERGFPHLVGRGIKKQNRQTLAGLCSHGCKFRGNKDCGLAVWALCFVFFLYIFTRDAITIVKVCPFFIDFTALNEGTKLWQKLVVVVVYSSLSGLLCSLLGWGRD